MRFIPLDILGALGVLVVRFVFTPFWGRKSTPPNTPRAHARLVPLMTAANQAEADIVVGLLKTHAISALARVGGSGLAYSTSALQPYAISVLEPDLPRARAVLAAYREDDALPE